MNGIFMKIIIFGATGTIGRHVLEQSLTQRHTVTAFCRDTSKIEQSHPNLIQHQGDVFDKDAVTKATRNHDAVIIVLGSGMKRNGTVRSEGTLNIICAMKECNITRLICQSTWGTGESRNSLNFFWKHVMFGWFLKNVYLDHEKQEEIVRSSELNYTIVRPTAFTDGSKTGVYNHGISSSDTTLTHKIARADVADFILKQLDSAVYLNKSPGISY